MTLLKKFHPTSFDMTKLRTVGNAYCEICYVDGVRYERILHTHIQDTRYFKEDQSISEKEYEDETWFYKKLCKNKVPFLWDFHVCYLDIYLLPNYQIIPIITLEFGTHEEMQEFVKPDWFGEEVNLRFYDEENMWTAIWSEHKP